MKIKTLENTSIKKITDSFNLAFSDYFTSFHLTPEQLSSKMKADKIYLKYSVGVFEDENLIAFILHGTDTLDNKKVVYNGGTGVIPDKRGQGLTKQMYTYILPILKEQKIDYIILEVISKNIQAIKSYEKVGFNAIRELGCYKGEIAAPYKISNAEIKELHSYDWELMQPFWDLKPTWQNSINVVNELKESNQSIGAYIDNKLVGYLIFNPTSKRIHQFAVDKNFRKKGIASKLIKTIIEKSTNDLTIINVDKNSHPINSFLSKNGFDNFLDQIEMKLEL